MKLDELEGLVIDWAKEKGILEKATPFTQHTKTLEEVEELTEALGAKEKGLEEFVNIKGLLVNTDHEIKDAIGDIMVTLIIQSEMNGYSIKDALEMAYNTISKRTGKMVDGVFVKDGD